MATIPILLDARPPYLGDAGSLLLLPTGAGVLLDEIAQAAAAVTAHAPLVLPLFAHDADYVLALRERGVAPQDVGTPAVFRDPLARFEPSDQLLLVSAACYPADGLDLRRVRDARVDDARMLRHLLAFETSTLGTKELVQPGSDGRLRRIQRYFEPVTWPFPAGVIASLVPVACVLTGADAPWESLAELRRALAARGVPSQDVPFHDRFFHLDDESGALALSELRVHELTGAGRRRGPAEPVVVGDGATVHPTARLLGPIVIGEGVEVGEDALVVGPTLLGAGSRVGRGATVAQCLVPAGAHVPARASLRHGVAGSGRRGARRGAAQQRHTASAAPAESAAETSAYAAVKDVVEPVVAALVLLALLPLFAVVALLVVATSRGAAFYGDPREGKDGRSFRCWKFRSMRRDASMLQRTLMAAQQLDGPQFKMDRDPRVTAVGAWLRRLNVDELPQLWNVVRGEMSFVGPRPSPFRENQICVPWRHGRLSVRPGITGLWQVCRRDRASGDFHQWIHYDLLYVRHASLAVDLRILVATVLTLGGRRPVAINRIIPRAPSAATHARRMKAAAVVLGPLVAQAVFASAVGAQRGPLAARLSVEAGGGYESNVRFQRADDAGDVARTVRVAASGALRAARSDVTLSAAGDATSYQTLRDLDRLTYQLALDAGRALTRRLRLQGGAVARRSQASTIEQGGVTLPLVALTRSDAVGGALSTVYRLAPRTTLLAATSFTDVRYSASALAGGTTTTGDASVERRASPHLTLGARYHAERTALAAQTLTSHAVTGEWSVSRGGFALRARGGVTMTGASSAPDTATTLRSASPVGDVSVERRRGRTGISLVAGRAVSPTLGIGRVLATDHAGATLERAARLATLRAAVDHAWSADPNDAALRLRATTATLDARRPIARSHSWVALGAFLRERRTGNADNAGDVVRDHGVTLGVGVSR